MLPTPDDPTEDWTRPGVFEVAPGVHRIPLPLPTDGLRAVNVYAVEDGDGLTMIDSGWAISEARELLGQALGALECGFGDVHRFLVTHVHRDHYTMAIELRREFGNRVALGVGEQPGLQRVAGQGGTLVGGQELRLQRAGAKDLLEYILGMAPEPHDQTLYTDPDDWLEDRAEVALKTRTLQSVPTPGHTRGHVVFHDDELLFAGDHVLPHITPSIGFEPEPTELPLGDYLGSLRTVRELPDRRLLPAHGPVAPSVHDRIDELLDHHRTRLDATSAVVAEGANIAHEVASRLRWTRRGRAFDDLDPFNQMLATIETLAHLELLVARGRLTAEDVDGVAHYRLP